MMPKCLNCSLNLSFSWFAWAMFSTKNRCVNCGALHQFTPRHKTVYQISTISMLLGMNLLGSVISGDIVKVVILCSIIFPFIIFVPGQYILASQDNLEFKIKK